MNWKPARTKPAVIRAKLPFAACRAKLTVVRQKRMAIKITGVSKWPEFIEINNITVRFGWWGYYNDTGTYMGQIRNFHARDCLNGFQHRLGTTMTFTNCFASGGRLGFYISNVLAVTMTNCAADSLSVKVSDGFGGGTGCYFESVQGLTINGWDAEANTVNCDSGGSTPAYWRFVDTYALVSGLIGLDTVLSTSGAGSAGAAAWIRAENNSNVTLAGCQDTASGSITYTGTGGYPVTLQCDATSRVNVIGSKFGAATGGSPAISVVATDANVAFTNSLVTGLVTCYEEIKDAGGLKTNAFYTKKGTQAVTATVPQTLFTLPDSEGVYLVNVWVSGSGTNYSSSALFVWDGTSLHKQDIKAGTFTVLGSSVRDVFNTSAGTTTCSWSYVKLS